MCCAAGFFFILLDILIGSVCYCCSKLLSLNFLQSKNIYKQIYGRAIPMAYSFIQIRLPSGKLSKAKNKRQCQANKKLVKNTAVHCFILGRNSFKFFPQPVQVGVILANQTFGLPLHWVEAILVITLGTTQFAGCWGKRHSQEKKNLVFFTIVFCSWPRKTQSCCNRSVFVPQI